MIKIKPIKYMPVLFDSFQIRPINESDFSTYRLWFKNHFNPGFIDSRPEAEVDRMITLELSKADTFVLSKKDLRIGEINIQQDQDITFENVSIKKHIYSLSLSLYESISESEVELVVKNICNLVPLYKGKIKVLYIFSNSQNTKLSQYFITNGFSEAPKDTIILSKRIKKTIEDQGLPNLYKNNAILFKIF